MVTAQRGESGQPRRARTATPMSGPSFNPTVITPAEAGHLLQRVLARSKHLLTRYGREVQPEKISIAKRQSIRICTPHGQTSASLNLYRALLIPCASPLAVSRTFNFLFKVLFIFPSRYLFAIGLVSIFSFRRSLPPILGCIPKQPDSWRVYRGWWLDTAHGTVTLYGVLFQATWVPSLHRENTSRDYNSVLYKTTQISSLSSSRFTRRY